MKQLLFVTFMACSVCYGEYNYAQDTQAVLGHGSSEPLARGLHARKIPDLKTGSPFSRSRLRPAPEDELKILLEPYLMLPQLNGTIGIGRLPDISVDADFDDVLSSLKFAAMLYSEASKGSWAVTSDLLYSKLGEDAEPSNIINSASVELEQLGWELAVLRKFLPGLDGGIGFNLNSIKSEVDLTVNTPGGSASRNGNLSETWVDPTLIVRVRYPFSEKWNTQLRGNVGGLGLGSDFSWQIQGYLGYQFSDLFSLSAGYRSIGADYEKGSGEDRFVYDLTTSGWVVRLGFGF